MQFLVILVKRAIAIAANNNMQSRRKVPNAHSQSRTYFVHICMFDNQFSRFLFRSLI